MKKILITGGAGFIGTHLTRALVANGHDVTIMDNFSEQIHGANADVSPEIRKKVQVVRASVTDKAMLFNALQGKDAVIHLAAETGTGQSMYNISGYTGINIQATAFLCDYLVGEPHDITTVVVASSRAIYGEGKYYSAGVGMVYPESRTAAGMGAGFEVKCPVKGTYDLQLQKTDEDSLLHPSSYYGITKQVQEQMVILACKLKGIDGFALRYQNVYGPGQSLKNPYTGILSIFSRLALGGETINVFEDGLESRDFVYVEDAVRATLLCLEGGVSGQHILNVGSGVATTVIDVANQIIAHVKSSSKVVVSGAFREGDIRHNLADLTRVGEVIGFKPFWTFTDGLHRFLDWVMEQDDIPATTGDYEKSLRELRDRGLLSD